MTTIPAHIERILDLARWAPSGDNTQPWRFEVLGEEHVLVHGFDTRDHCVYDLDGHASQLALGALLETMTIAASTEGRTTRTQRRPDAPEAQPLFDVYFQQQDGLAPDFLAPYVEKRVVQRRPMSTQPLSAEQKQTLAKEIPDGYEVVWYEGLSQRWRLAKFMFDNAKVRLTIPEAYSVHKSVIEWGARFSDDKIPEQAVGVDPLTARFMRWVMASWARVNFVNKWFFGHVPPRLQLDFLPGVSCAAHFALISSQPLRTIDDYLAAGRCLQRFWLAATRLGLLIQPEMTPVIFTRYFRHGLPFTRSRPAVERVATLNERLGILVEKYDIECLYFMGRVGVGPMPISRSTRMAVARLWVRG